MSIICNKCGIQTRDGAKFCHGCGTPIATAALPPTMQIGTPSGDISPKPAVPLAPENPMPASFAKATETMGASPTAYIPQAPPVPSYQQVPAKPKKSNNGIKIFVGILIFFGVITIAGIVGGLFLAGKVIDEAKNKPVEIEFGKNGKFKVNQPLPTEAELGVPVYPNAKAMMPMSVEAQNDAGEGGAVHNVTMETKDDYRRVKEWYSERLGSDIQIKSQEDDERLNTKYSIDDEKGHREVEITGYPDSDQNTEIKILSVIKKSTDKTEPPSAAAPEIKAEKKKAGTPLLPTPPAPASAQKLEEKIEKQSQEILNQSEKMVQEQIERVPLPPRARRQIREQMREARQQENQSRQN